MVAVNRPQADKECQEMNDLKRSQTGKSSLIRAWDRFYYGQHITAAAAAKSQAIYTPISPYFSVGNVFVGLSGVFESLYGIRLEMQEVVSGEVWHDDVRKLSVIHETEGLIGTIYCDMFQRETGNQRKFDNAAHFTVRCSRRIDNDEQIETSTNHELVNKDYEKVQSDSSGDKRYQLPIVVLVTNFARPHDNIPSLLELNDIETLFHEMGHAMHCNHINSRFSNVGANRFSAHFWHSSSHGFC